MSPQCQGELGVACDYCIGMDNLPSVADLSFLVGICICFLVENRKCETRQI